MFNVPFWKATLERSIGTAASIFLTLYGTDAVGWLSVNHLQALEITAMAFIVTAIKCIAVAATSDGGPSLGNSEVLAVKTAAVAPAPVAEGPSAPAPLNPPLGGLHVGE